jgi:hypothetical protein
MQCFDVNTAGEAAAAAAESEGGMESADKDSGPHAAVQQVRDHLQQLVCRRACRGVRCEAAAAAE